MTQQSLVDVTIVHGPWDLAGTIALGTIDPDTGALTAFAPFGIDMLPYVATVAADGQTLTGTWTVYDIPGSFSGDHTCDVDAQCDDDQNACTANACSAGTCTFPPVPDFSECPDDGQVCTRDWCMAGTCVHPPAADLTICNDNNSCTASDKCQGGVCKGTCQVGQPCGGSGHCAAGGGCNPTCSCQ